MSTPALPPLPAAADVAFALRLAQFRAQAPAASGAWLDRQCADAGFAQALQRVWYGSEFVAETCARRPELLIDLVASGDLFCAYAEGALAARAQTALTGIASEPDLHRALRQLRQREMVRIIWRDLNRDAYLSSTTGDLSALADACIQGGLAWLQPRLNAELGTPIGAVSSEPQQLVVIAMGKLGGNELNLSSDIDLIFAYPEEGATEGGRRQRNGVPLSNREFFARLGQQLIQALDKRTVDGFVFRVDLRLRPFGHSGALAYSFAALEQYYQNHGRDWERYAMVKARPVTGTAAAGARLLALLRAFTYRRYIDFSVIESLRDMKATINREVARKGLDDDIKRGAGGIREIEFSVQAVQLVRGGRDARFQNPRLRDALELIGREGLLPLAVTAELEAAYGFLRNLEHVLQAWRDQQTQQLPSATADRERVATLMGHANWASFATLLNAHRARVRAAFAEVIAANTPEQQSLAASSAALDAWQDEDAGAALVQLGYAPEDRDSTRDALAKLRASAGVRAMTAAARGRLDHFMPALLTACARTANGGECLARALRLVEAVARRSAYLVLLSENPGALEQLVRLCAASPWIADELSRYPVLLDELLDARTLYTPPQRAHLQDQLRQQATRIPEDDTEAQLEVLRYFRRAHALRVAAGEVMGTLPLMKVSDYLTWLAEVILEQVLALAWHQMIARHGAPGRGEGGAEPAFLIVGYGKLGGIELSHGSDLDLVFIYAADPNLATVGPKPIDNGTFFARLGQRIIHILSARTATGTLYDVDMRLRPSGNSGLLVTSIEAFARYQQESAWTWEHQALVRARPVAGDPQLAARFAQVRAAVLARPRDRAALAREVVAMRARMAAHRGDKSGGKTGAAATRFDLKHGRGGIVDIEFMVQFGVLAAASECAELTRWTDNIRILDALGDSGLLPAADVAALQDAYQSFRAAGHRRQLQQQPQQVAATEFGAERAAVTAIWEHLFGASEPAS